MTGTSIWPNWVVVAPFDCLLHFLCFWSIVIHYQDLSAIFSFFVSSKLSEQSEPVPFLPGSFHYMFSCISSVSWHPVKFNTLPILLYFPPAHCRVYPRSLLPHGQSNTFSSTNSSFLPVPPSPNHTSQHSCFASTFIPLLRRAYRYLNLLRLSSTRSVLALQIIADLFAVNITICLSSHTVTIWPHYFHQSQPAPFFFHFILMLLDIKL